MKIANILEIARALIDEVAEFDMLDSTFDTSCGSAGCIAGHIAYLYPRKTGGVIRCNGDGSADDSTVRIHFQIPGVDALRIFMGSNRDETLADVTRWTAAAALINYIRTKRVEFRKHSKTDAISMVEKAEKEFL